MLCVIPSLINGPPGWETQISMAGGWCIKERFHCCCCCWIKKKGGIVVANHQPFTSIGGISAFMACDWKNDLDWKKSWSKTKFSDSFTFWGRFQICRMEDRLREKFSKLLMQTLFFLLTQTVKVSTHAIDFDNWQVDRQNIEWVVVNVNPRLTSTPLW